MSENYHPTIQRLVSLALVWPDEQPGSVGTYRSPAVFAHNVRLLQSTDVITADEAAYFVRVHAALTRKYGS